LKGQCLAKKDMGFAKEKKIAKKKYKCCQELEV